MEYTITLEPQLDEFLRSKIETGQYGSATDLIADALRRLAETDSADARLRRSLAQAEAGEDTDIDEVFDKLDRHLADLEQRHST